MDMNLSLCDALGLSGCLGVIFSQVKINLSPLYRNVLKRMRIEYLWSIGYSVSRYLKYFKAVMETFSARRELIKLLNWPGPFFFEFIPIHTC
jgi:hypothetical protein